MIILRGLIDCMVIFVIEVGFYYLLIVGFMIAVWFDLGLTVLRLGLCFISWV